MPAGQPRTPAVGCFGLPELLFAPEPIRISTAIAKISAYETPLPSAGRKPLEPTVGVLRSVTEERPECPGLGRVQQNTDTAPQVVDGTTTADDDQVSAFGRLAASPAEPFVMTSSAVYTTIDPAAPAAFSPAVVTDLLRGQLRFRGVVVSDDLGNAKAVESVPVGERAVRFLAAGGPLVLTVDPTIVPAMIDAVLARADADAGFAAQVDAAVRTALLAKARAGLLPG